MNRGPSDFATTLNRPALQTFAIDLLSWCVARCDDAALQQIYAARYTGLEVLDAEKRDALFGFRMWMLPYGKLLEFHRVTTARARRSRNAPRKLRPNEPCRCGSGKKFKRCCIDKPVESPSFDWARYLAVEGDQFEAHHLTHLPRGALALVDFTRLALSTLIALACTHAENRDWRLAAACVAHVSDRWGKGGTMNALQHVISRALEGRHFAVAHSLLQGAAGSRSGMQHLHTAAMLGYPERVSLDQLEHVAKVMLTQASATCDDMELAVSVMRATPALGILLARGAMQSQSPLENEALLECIEESRDRLLLPPGDRAQRLFEELGGVRLRVQGAAISQEQHEKALETADELRQRLEKSSAQVAALKAQVADRQRELAKSEHTIAELSSRSAKAPSDDLEGRARALREKVESLQAQIRENNAERAQLRRQLSATSTPVPAMGRVIEEADKEDDGDDGEDFPSATSPVRTVTCSDSVTRSLAQVPRAVASAAMRRVGALAAGDAAEWRSVKQARDMPRQVLMARVGLHHRLLFRVEAGSMVVIDLVPRGSLFLRLKSLRAS